MAQVWVIAAYKRFIHKGSVEIHETGNIEIGFADYGHSVALLGTLQAVNHELFIKRIRAVVTRERDHAQVHLDWRAFRSTAFTANAQAPAPLEAAASFLLRPESPFKYNIFFAESAFIAEHAPAVKQLVESWNEFVITKLKEQPQDLSGRAAEILADPTIARQLSEEFLKGDQARDTWSALDRAFYWSPGEYLLELFVECSKPLKTFTRKWRFRLEAKDSDVLRLNSIGLLQAATARNVTYHFAYPEYQAA